MKATDDVGITFANLVLGQGYLNGVVNVLLGALQFTPENGKIVSDPVITARLRMDLPCAAALREALTVVINSMSTPLPQNGVVGVVAEDAPTEGKPN